MSTQGLAPSACPVVQFIPEEHVLGRSLRQNKQDFDHASVKLDFPAEALAVEKASVFPQMKGDDRALAESSFYCLKVKNSCREEREIHTLGKWRMDNHGKYVTRCFYNS
jgi:hypothetical protein